MNRDELIERAKLTHEWSYLLTSLDFRKVETEVLRDKSSITRWSRQTSHGDVEFFVSNEDQPAILGNAATSKKTRWEKLDFILNFHADGDWSVAEQLIMSGDILLDGPLSEIANEARARGVNASLSAPLEERLEFDPQFRQVYEKQLRELSARQLAQDTLSASSGSRIHGLSELSPQELREITGWIDWDSLWADEEEERWFVKDLICEGRAHACPAEAGIGKSLLWMEVGAGLACGASVLGFPPQEPIRVLYLDHENTPKGDIKPRLKAMGFEPEQLANFIYLSFPTIEALNTKLGGQSLSELVEHFRPNLVFIDTFSRFVEGDENSSSVAQDFYEHAGRDLKRRNIAYVRLDHIGKDASRGARGSSAKVDDLDLIWSMSRTKEENVFSLKNQKARVPISQDEVLVERKQMPLRHVIRRSSVWMRLIAIAERQEIAISLIEGLEPSHSLAQGRVWRDLGQECQKHGITRKELLSALEFVKGGYHWRGDELI